MIPLKTTENRDEKVKIYNTDVHDGRQRVREDPTKNKNEIKIVPYTSHNFHFVLKPGLTESKRSGVAIGVGGRVPPLYSEKFAKNREKEGENQEKAGKREKNRAKEENREFSFNLPLLTDRAGYATE